MPGKLRNLQALPTSPYILTALILFIDNPEHASPKPALVAAIPADAVSKAYEGTLARLRNSTALFAGEKYLFYSHYPNWNDGWDINMYRKRIQSGESLPSRITAAVADISEEEPESIIWMGPDSVAVEPAQREDFLAATTKTDLVIGQSDDGEILMLGFGRNAFTFEIPETFIADDLAAHAEVAGLRVVRVNLPAPPSTVEELVQLGINLD